MEHFFICPHCGKQISMILDPSTPRQTYVEDCEVCCRPIEIAYEMQDDALAAFAANRIE
ncbi:MAG: CPXCG motif-containing cysteine-rich protein [Candidatus Acidiferrales bacterium]